ncbi:MAG: alpha/beta hydrolase-fold protein [Polyangiales bacterium]
MNAVARLVMVCALLAACGDDGDEPAPQERPDASTPVRDSAVPMDARASDAAMSAPTDAYVPEEEADAGGDAATDAARTDAGQDSGVRDPGTQGDGDLTVGPTYTKDSDLTDKGAPKGRLFGGQDAPITLKSSDSQIFKGDDTTLNTPRSFTRGIQVYVPAAYKDGTAAPFLVIQDGPGQIGLVSRALDNLTRSSDPDRKLPAFIVIAVQNGGGDSKGSQRGLEYDTMSDRYARFVQTEVLPAVLSNAAIKKVYPNLQLTDDPQGRATMGCSSGGAAALTMAWFKPAWFGRVISYSGTFVDQQDDDAAEEKTYPLGAWEYHSGKKLIANSPRQELRIFMHVSEMDNGFSAPESGHHNWVLANQRTAAALKDKGYHYRFVTAKSAGHCDGKVFDATLAETLAWTWRGYPTE